MFLLNRGEIQAKRFPNGEMIVRDDLKLSDWSVLEFKYRNDSDLILLMFLKKVIDEFRLPCTLYIWYMPYSRMDRKIEGTLFTLKYVCQFIADLHFENVIIMEPHSEETIKLLTKYTRVRSALELLQKYIFKKYYTRVKAVYPVIDWLPQIMAKNDFGENDCLVFPDKGAAKRYSKIVHNCNVCVFKKKRNPLTGDIEDMQLVEGTVNPGSKCIIIDDLCSKGGTFAWAASILKSKGASEVILVVAHCEETIFAGKLLLDDSPISRIYTSNSMMDKQNDRIEYMDVEVEKYV
jgi:ribose-phosphate pyrophosphokinase